MKEKDMENKKIRILFVCLGNICRSPAAEGVMKELIKNKGLADLFVIDSAGTSGCHQGELPDERMRAHGRRRGYDFCSRSRKFQPSDFDNFDYIVAMDDENYRNISTLALTAEDKRKIYRMCAFSSNLSHSYIPDPYYGDSAGFELVLDLLEEATESFFKKIRTDYNIQDKTKND